MFLINELIFHRCWVFVAVHRPSSCSEQRLLLVVACLVAEHRLSEHMGTVAWCAGLVAPQRAKSSLTRGHTHAPCTGRQASIHWTPRVVPARGLS